MMSVVLSIVATSGLVLFLRRRVVLAAYFEGQRDGLKQARTLLNERGNVALRLAPEGKLSVGVVRAQIAHDMASEVGTLIHQVGR